MENIKQTFNPFFSLESMPQNTYLLDFKLGDVNGDKTTDKIYLMGNKSSPYDIFADNIYLLIQDGKNNNFNKIPLKNAAGYNSQLFLGQFTSKHRADILIKIEAGGTEGYIIAYLYNVKNEQANLLFDETCLEESSIYNAIFIDNFKLHVSEEKSNKTFKVDIEKNKKLYVDSGIYSIDGKLLKPTMGKVLSLYALSPVVNNFDGLYELLAYQRIIGKNNEDYLGDVETFFKWNGTEMIIERVDVSIFSE